MRPSVLLVVSVTLFALAAAKGGRCSRKGGGACRPDSKSLATAHRSVSSTKKLFYGAGYGHVDVTIYGHGTHWIKIYLNGELLAHSITCYESVTAGATVWQGDVIAVEAGSAGPDYAFAITVTSATGDSVYMTTGQVGWKAVPIAQAGDNWQLSSYNDSHWPDAVVSPTGSTCEADSIIVESGAADLWAADTAEDTIAARYKVGLIGKDCSCTQGRPGCPQDGMCRACVFAENSGTSDCYADWNQDQCEEYGVVDNGEYIWCGASSA